MSIRLLRLATLGIALLTPAGPAQAAEPIVLSLLTNRTGPSAGIGGRVANGMRDYLEMLNQRDGGIGGARLVLEECEAASDPERGVHCYESARKAGAVLISAPDRIVTRALIEPTMRDRVPLLSLADGFPVGTRGDVMPWVFNPSAWVLGGLTITIRYLGDKLGGLSELKGLSIGLAYSAGADPAALATLRDLAKLHGFATPLYALEDIEADVAVWERIAEQRPHHLILLGQGVQAGTAVERALRVGYPVDRLIALRWPDETVLRKAGSASRGFREISRHAFGDSFPAFDEIDLHVIDRGLSKTPKD
ncbi:MAG TPA: ABC transporter substrate-binding protein, partial [Methylobacterium sp.]